MEYKYKGVWDELFKQNTLIILIILLMALFVIVGLIIFIPTYRIVGLIMKPFVWLYKNYINK